jgi:hypothetical protein
MVIYGRLLMVWFAPLVSNLRVGMRFSGSFFAESKGGYLSKEMDWLRMPVRYSRGRR